jgi:hypothetical protein
LTGISTGLKAASCIVSYCRARSSAFVSQDTFAGNNARLTRDAAPRAKAHPKPGCGLVRGILPSHAANRLAPNHRRR